MESEVGDRLSLDTSLAANITRLDRWINLTIQDICSRRDWKWLQEREIVQTTTDRVFGTVAVALGGTTVTGTGTAFSIFDVRSFIQFQGANDWYEITARASTTSITISPGYEGPVALTAATNIIRTVFYSLTSDVSRVLDIRQAASPMKLACLGYTTLDLYQPDIEQTGPPRAYTLFRHDPAVGQTSAKKRQFQLFPVADNFYNLEIRYIKILSDLSAAGDISDIPVPFHNVIMDGAEWLGSKFINDPREPQLKQAYEFSLQKMIEEDNANDDYLPVLRASDSNMSSKFLPFPADFSQPM